MVKIFKTNASLVEKDYPDWEDLPVMTTSERSSAGQCWQQWWWGYREGLRPMGPPSDALWFGQGIHLALAKWYPGPRKNKKGKTISGFKRGVDPRETWENFCDDEIKFIKANFSGSEFDEPKWIDAQELGLDMLDNYLDEYGDDEHVEMIEPEQAGEVLIPDPSNPTNPIVRYNFTFDGVYRDHKDDGAIKLWEHKTAASISTKHLSLDRQAGSYWAVATTQLRNDGKIGPGERIVSITYNFLRKATKDERPQNAAGMYLNQDGSVSKRQPPANFLRYPVNRTPRERNEQIRRIANEAKHMDLIRKGELPITKNTARDCSWCPFFQMCELHEAGSDWEDYRDAVYRVEDPYSNYRMRKSA